MDSTKIHHSLRAEMAVAKIKELYEKNEYVYHTKICKEFNIKIISVISLLKKEHFFNELKMQNKRIAYEKNVLYRHKTSDSKKDLKASAAKEENEDPIILREIRKKAKVVVKLEGEHTLDFSLFKRKAMGVRLRADYQGNFSDYVCGEGRTCLY